MNTLSIRRATAADLPAINDIYNHFVLHSTCTYQEEPSSLREREEWFEGHGEAHPVTVAQLDDVVVGWASLSQFNSRSAYRFSVENSVYVRHDLHKNGIGSTLLADLIERARAAGHRAIIAGIDAEQLASIALHRKFSFEEVGRLKQVGFKFGRWLDVIYMQRLL